MFEEIFNFIDDPDINVAAIVASVSSYWLGKVFASDYIEMLKEKMIRFSCRISHCKKLRKQWSEESFMSSKEKYMPIMPSYILTCLKSIIKCAVLL